MTTTSQQQASPAGSAAVPQVIASYAAYLQARTRTIPQATVRGDHADLTLSIGTKALVVAFQLRQREWSLRSAELRHGERTATFTRGQLAEAVTALLRP